MVVSKDDSRGRAGRAGSEALAPEHLASSQRDFELEAAVGIAELVAEQVVFLTQPVAHGLRVNMDTYRHLVRVAAVLKPGEERLGQPVLLSRAQALQRSVLGGPQRARQLLVGEKSAAWTGARHSGRDDRGCR